MESMQAYAETYRDMEGYMVGCWWFGLRTPGLRQIFSGLGIHYSLEAAGNRAARV